MTKLLRLYDNTRLSDYKRCPRMFFFRHVCGWVVDGPARAPLVFGGAWHAAMDVVWERLSYGDDRQMVLSKAYDAFVAYWVDAGMPPPDEIDMELAKIMSPRTPMIAMEMLSAYIEKRQSSIGQMELLEVERPFAVPLSPTDPTLFYIGRIDKVVRVNSRAVRGIEHKTTTAMRLSGKERRIAPQFMESFSPNSQVDGYLAALHLLFPGQGIDVWVDAALVHKDGEDFKFIPVERQVEQLDAWLGEVHHWVGQIETQKALLEQTGTQDRYMPAFPKNTNSCFDFNTQCAFLGLCKARSNPLTWREAPGGYREERWDPLDHIGTPPELK